MRSVANTACTFVLLLALPALAGTDMPPVAAGAAAAIPQFGAAHVADGQNVEIRYAVDKVVIEATLPNPEKIASTVEGQPVMQQRRVAVEQRVRVVEIAQLTAKRADGTAISKDDLAKALAKPTAVLLGQGGQKIDPMYLDLLKPNTLVLMLPVEPVQPRPVVPQNPSQLAQPPRPAVPAAPVIPRKFGS
jgi:hypothetical protein